MHPAGLDAGNPCRHDGCDAVIASRICRLLANRRTSLFSFAEYLAACCGDEGEENPP